jgi:DNA polymerase-3 subunit epsilon
MQSENNTTDINTMSTVNDINNLPDTLVLNRIKLNELVLPHWYHTSTGEEIPMVILDLETTGLDAEVDGITEVGLLLVMYSPQFDLITGIVDRFCAYNDPKVPISDFITDFTGITQDMVEGTNVELNDISHFFENDPIVIAHNSNFDRKFFDKKFPELVNLRWVCSKDDVDWRGMYKFESDKLEFLNYKSGYFYAGHNALVDCFALLNLMLCHPRATTAIYEAKDKVEYNIHVINSPFHTKDDLKARGCRWKDPCTIHGKHWWYKGATQETVEEVKADLLKIAPKASLMVESFNAMRRFK